MKSNMASLFLLLVFSLVISTPFCSPTSLGALNKGQSLSVKNQDQVLISSNRIFSSGFYAVGDNAYCFAIWFNDPSCPYNCTVVWMANRDEPINGRGSKLSLLKSGNLVLTDAGYSIVWDTKTSSLSSSLSLVLQNTGNLVLVTKEGVVLWQSFDSPTDTLLPRQALTRDTQLVSLRTQSNVSSGFYKLSFNDDNVLRLLYDGPDVSSVFWPDHWLLSREAGRSSYNSSRIAMLDSFGNFTSSDNFSFYVADYGAMIQRRLTLDFDGNLRLYSRENWRDSWVVSWQAFAQTCRIHGACGPNSVCSYFPIFVRKCSCLPGFRMKNHTDWSLGCEPEVPHLSCNKSEVTFLQLPHVEMYGYDFGFLENYTLEMCKEVCLQRCDCKGFELKFSFQNHPDNVPYCFPKTQLLNGYRSPNFQGNLYLKVPKINHFSRKWVVNPINLDCPDEVAKAQLDRKYEERNGNWSLKFLLWFVSAIGVVEIFGIILAWFFLIRTQQIRLAAATQGYLLALTGFKRFTYTELKKATRNFKEEIGRGAGGIVYKGILQDHRVAAIKLLNNAANQGEAEFLAEVSTIGKLNHMNLIEIWGYCAEGMHRLLVYQYVEHGSLAENLSSKALDCKKMFKIALGTAKGLAYLHEECLEWVLHCDVKPQNILLDSDYHPKVSDFGLSRLLSRDDQLKNSCFSRIRGTRGYMAPEWVFNLPITSKVDVYSYGIVVLEMLTGKSPVITGAHNAGDRGAEVEKERLVDWVKEKKNRAGAMTFWVKEIIDPVMGNDYDLKKMETLARVALQCVEESKDSRPTMSQVVEMILSHENDH